MRYWNIKNNQIKLSGDTVTYFPYNGLRGWKFDRRDLYIPLTKENIDYILKHTKDTQDNFLPAFAEASLNEVNRARSHKGKLKFVKKITLDNIDANLPIIDHKSPKPFRNQKIGLEWTKRFNEHGMFWDMGTGKTRTAIETFILKKKQRLVSKALVVCPAGTMVEKWCDEVHKWSDFVAIPLVGPRQKKIEAFEEQADFYVINYESIKSLQEEFENRIDNKWMIIADETSKIKNVNADRTKALLSISRLAKVKITLNGTPVTQGPADLFTQFLFLDNGASFGLSYDRFIAKYFFLQGYRKIPKHGSLEEIKSIVFEKSTRFLKEECIDIPAKMYDIRKVELTPTMKEKYDQMVRYFIMKIESEGGVGIVKAPIVLVQLLRLSQITSGFASDTSGNIIDFEDQPKLEALEEIFQEANLMNGSGNKMVVWSRFQHDVEKIMKLCKNMNIKAVDLYGKTPIPQRPINVKQFETDDTTKVLCGTPDTGGLGIDLIAANCVTYYSNSYSLLHRLQSEDRTHRSGQSRKVQYIDLLANKTVDTSIYQILRQKKRVADIITGDNLLSLTEGTVS